MVGGGDDGDGVRVGIRDVDFVIDREDAEGGTAAHGCSGWLIRAVGDGGANRGAGTNPGGDGGLLGVVQVDHADGVRFARVRVAEGGDAGRGIGGGEGEGGEREGVRGVGGNAR